MHHASKYCFMLYNEFEIFHLPGLVFVWRREGSMQEKYIVFRSTL